MIESPWGGLEWGTVEKPASWKHPVAVTGVSRGSSRAGTVAEWKQQGGGFQMLERG